MGRSESTGATSPNSDLNGAPKRRRAVGEFSSAISLRTWWAISSRLRSAIGQKKAFEEEESEHPDSVLASRSGSGPEVVRNRWSWRTPCVRPPSVDGGFRWGQLLCSRGRRPLVATTSCEKMPDPVWRDVARAVRRADELWWCNGRRRRGRVGQMTSCEYDPQQSERPVCVCFNSGTCPSILPLWSFPRDGDDGPSVVEYNK